MSTPATVTPRANSVPIARGDGTLAPGWFSPSTDFSTAIAGALSVTVANIANPVELNLLGTSTPDMHWAKQTTAGSDAATLYMLDASNDAANPPFTLASLTPGLVWVAVAGWAMLAPRVSPTPLVGAITVTRRVSNPPPFQS